MNKKHPDCLYLDIRPTVNPDLVCDTRALPKEVGSGYDLIVFDPPHVHMGKTSNMARVYGYHTTEEIRDTVMRSAKEAHRVSRGEALMAFKWNDHDMGLQYILSLMSDFWEPLFGHWTRNGPEARSQTYWVMLKRKDNTPSRIP
jgi:hypothetical protein